MASCGLKQDRKSDSFTEWKEEYAHRCFCDMLNGNCELHDNPKSLSKHQDFLRNKIECYEKEIDILKNALNKHQEKWGKLNPN